ncbi:MAG: hypothetical protein IJ226_03255, partial [Clostridia bacterium]|nr:hypothetical protein [Clostridia bacterium]
MKTHVALVFGGRSMEHDVSVITAMQALANIDKTKYIVEPVYMKDGDFFVQNVDRLDEFVQFDETRHKRAVLVKGEFYVFKRQGIKKYFKPDVVLIACYGGEGENGNLQALLEINGLAYTSPDVFASSLCMDKEFSKRMFESMLLPVLPYESACRSEYLHDKQQTLFSLESFLTYPMIVKPARLGSSIGISVANDRIELQSAIDLALEFDDKVVIEQKLEDFAEVNCAAFFDGERVVVSRTEQPVSSNDF